MRLIDADALIDKWNKLLSKMIPTADGAHPVDFGIIITEISKQPTIESAPVVHGEWIMKDKNGNGVCSNCNRQDKIDSLATHCRYCGAKMDK